MFKYWWNCLLAFPDAAFSYAVNGVDVDFSNTSQRAGSYLWLFGNGKASTAISPSHIYSSPGTYQVKLIASRCGYHDTASHTVTVPTAAGVSSQKTQASIAAYFDASGTLQVHSERLLGAGTVITIFSMDGRVISRQITTANTHEARLKLPRTRQHYVVAVDDRMQGLYWRQILQQ